MVDTKVEIQIRTIAMDFWASLEHKIYYKFEGNAPEYISRDLRECSSIVSMLDAKMLSLNEAIMEAKKEQGDPRPESWDRNAQAHTGDEDEDEISIQEEMEWNLHRSDLEDEDGALNQASVQADKKA